MVIASVEADRWDAEQREGKLVSQLEFIIPSVVNVAQPKVTLGVLAPALDGERRGRWGYEGGAGGRIGWSCE